MTYLKRDFHTKLIQTDYYQQIFVFVVELSWIIKLYSLIVPAITSMISTQFTDHVAKKIDSPCRTFTWRELFLDHKNEDEKQGLIEEIIIKSNSVLKQTETPACAKSNPDSTYVTGSTTRKTNQLGTAKIAPPKACLRKN